MRGNFKNSLAKVYLVESKLPAHSFFRFILSRPTPLRFIVFFLAWMCFRLLLLLLLFVSWYICLFGCSIVPILLVGLHFGDSLSAIRCDSIPLNIPIQPTPLQYSPQSAILVALLSSESTRSTVYSLLFSYSLESSVTSLLRGERQQSQYWRHNILSLFNDSNRPRVSTSTTSALRRWKRWLWQLLQPHLPAIPVSSGKDRHKVKVKMKAMKTRNKQENNTRHACSW